ncbi:MarR family winged helix-turn-helix transcriptional regulator [Mycolicibacterium baixiangningiae]|uniref:MarR family winged helix-turn-helix transcriptional regulator n=1 Tax=Mycolicibacterium baixiangningiae TaxID=2761578 RepID=UPI001866B618|nr:MarR family winged helix-turn-helix transcriptional regulator [Mycolicibacterium baixiangningiae]
MTELPIVSPNWQLVGPLLEHLARRLRAASESEIEQFGLRARHVVALTLLRDFGERPQSDLAGMLRIDPTNVVGLLNELEAAELIERRRSPQDRRRHTVALTATGAARLGEVEGVLLDVERQMLSTLDDDEHAVLYRLLIRAVGETAACSPPANSHPCLADDDSGSHC